MAKLLRINMTTLTAKTEDVHEAYKKFGGRGLTASIIDREVFPTCDPLGSENKLIYAPGLMAGTTFPNSGRISVGAKSPLTGGIKEANSGGAMAQKFAKLGIKAVIIEGKAKEPTLVKINNNGVSFSKAASLAGLGTYAAIEKLRAEHGDNSTIACIGPAGEKGLLASSIMFTTPDFHIRVAARGGLGAVMGSKNLKAVVVDDKGSENKVEVKDQKAFKENAAAITKIVTGDMFGQGLRRFGTPQILTIANGAGFLPTKNYSMGNFDKGNMIDGEAMEKLLKDRPNANMTHRCMNGCIISCSNIYSDKNGKFIVASLEYETLALAGSNCLIGDLDTIAYINRECNDAGVDTMDVGAAIAVAMEAGMLKWGDGEAALNLVKEIAKGTENGNMIGNGVKFTGEKLGVKRIPHVKGQSMSGYDPRILKGAGVTYATTPMGADHTTGLVLPGPHHPDYVPVVPDGQAKESQFMQRWNAAMDALGLCMMIGMTIMEQRQPEGTDKSLSNCVAAMTGEKLGDDYIIDLGKSVLDIERKFNKEAGFTNTDDRLQKFFSEEKFGPGQFVFDVPDQELDGVHN